MVYKENMSNYFEIQNVENLTKRGYLIIGVIIALILTCI